MVNKKDSFVFYRSFFEAINDLPDDNQLIIFKAISEYALNFKEPELTGLSKTIFTLIKPQLNANNQRYLNGCKGAKYGKKGGRPKTPRKPLENPKETPKLTPKLTPNVNDNVNDNVNEDKKTKAKKDLDLKKEKEKILRKGFEEIYTIFKDGSKIIKFPFDNLKFRFENCCLDLREQGGFKFLKQQIVDYLLHVKTHNETKPDFQLSKVSFEVFINSRGQKMHWCEDWKAKTKELNPKNKEKEYKPEKTDHDIWLEDPKNLKIYQTALKKQKNKS